MTDENTVSGVTKHGKSETATRETMDEHSCAGCTWLEGLPIILKLSSERTDNPADSVKCQREKEKKLN